MTPSDIHSDLTMGRLIEIARLILKGRNDALDNHNVVIGDNGWTLGCRSFQCSRWQILEAADNGTFAWLTVVDRSMRLIFRIGAIPVRFFHGPAAEPTERTAYQSLPELKQLAFAFDEATRWADYIYRFAVETDVDGSVIAIKFAVLEGETLVHVWDIPLAATVIALTPAGAPLTEGVSLPPPSVGFPSADNREAKDAS